MQHLQKTRGWGPGLWLTRFPMRKSVLRSIATKDLSSHPIGAPVMSHERFCESRSPDPVGIIGREDRPVPAASSVPFLSTPPHLLFWKAKDDRQFATAAEERQTKEEIHSVTHATVS